LLTKQAMRKYEYIEREVTIFVIVDTVDGMNHVY